MEESCTSKAGGSCEINYLDENCTQPHLSPLIFTEVKSGLEVHCEQNTCLRKQLESYLYWE